ncbi:MAG: T9SS type A sorting domain-containing protein, partial [Bacteroidota bacterium]
IQDCVPNLVFPGDANNDGIVNAWDVLSIGLAYEESGIARPDATTDWVGQEAPDWNTTLANNVNAKHVDTNGDGLVDDKDMAIVLMNYNQQHFNRTTYQPSMVESETVELILELSSTVVAGEEVELSLLLPDATEIDDLYGIAFALESDVPFFKPGTMRFKQSNSCLSEEDNTMMMTQPMQTNDKIEVGLVKRDRNASICMGTLATVTFIAAENLPDNVTFRLTNVEAITSQGLNLMMTSEELSTVVSSTNELIASNGINISPSPFHSNFFIESESQISSICIYNAIGQKVGQLSVQTSEAIEIEAAELVSGLYFIELFFDDESRSVRQVLKQ